MTDEPPIDPPPFPPGSGLPETPEESAQTTPEGMPEQPATTPASKKVKIHKLEIAEEYQEKALERVKGIIEGNKFDTDKVTIANFEGELLQFEAETTIQISTKISKKQTPGRMRGPVQVENEQGLAREMNKEYIKMSMDRDLIRKIRDVATKRDDECFAQDGIVLDLPFWKKEFVFFEGCDNCRTQGKIKCQRCHGKGVDRCPRCHGKGMDHCSQCRGQQMIMGPQGNKIQCPRCHGRGQETCVLCNQSGTVQCPTCRTKGFTTCPTCQGHGWSSHLNIVEIEGKTSFKYPEDELPDKIVALMTELGPKMREHARITIKQEIEDPAQRKKEQEEDPEEKQENVVNAFRIPILYDVMLPNGHAEFDIDGKSYYTFLFGYKGEVTHVSPFLEDIIKNGMRKLDDAVAGRGDVAENLQKAAEYRTVKEVIICAARMPLMKAYKKLQERNPIGIRDETLRDLIMKADKSMKKITDKPLQMGMLGGVLAMGGLFAAYLYTPVRSMITEKLPNSALEIGVDISLVALAAYICTVIMKTSASGAIKKALTGIIPKEEEKKLKPKLGSKGMLAFILVAIIFAAVLESTRHTGADIPQWYANIFDNLKK